MAGKRSDKQKSFSPLQTGCAFVMLTNMLLYLVVVAFVFNLLDPSKLDSAYLAKRGFTAKNKPDDQAFRQLTEQRQAKQKKFYDDIAEGHMRPRKKEMPPGASLSEQKSRPRVSSHPDEKPLPLAARTPAPVSDGHPAVKKASTRMFDIDFFPSVSLQKIYPSRSATSVFPERYDALTIELAPGTDIPLFTIPLPQKTDSLIYTSPSGTQDATRSGVKVEAPLQSAVPSQTNDTEPAETNAEPEPAKDAL
jgi:hypothetical protein